MNIPKLRKEKTTKTYHGYELTDDYAYVDQSDILTVLKKPENLDWNNTGHPNTNLEFYWNQLISIVPEYHYSQRTICWRYLKID